MKMAQHNARNTRPTAPKTRDDTQLTCSWPPAVVDLIEGWKTKHKIGFCWQEWFCDFSNYLVGNLNAQEAELNRVMIIFCFPPGEKGVNTITRQFCTQKLSLDICIFVVIDWHVCGTNRSRDASQSKTNGVPINEVVCCSFLVVKEGALSCFYYDPKARDLLDNSQNGVWQ